MIQPLASASVRYSMDGKVDYLVNQQDLSSLQVFPIH